MVRTRIAPSPTGYPHIGTIYQALFNFAYARRYNGSFLVRIEDTDRSRFVEGAEEVIFSALDWFGLTEDESPRNPGSFGPYRQSERLSIYHEYVQKLIDSDHAYFDYYKKELVSKEKDYKSIAKSEHHRENHDTPSAPGSVQDFVSNPEKFADWVIRMRVPDDTTITIQDEIRGAIQFESKGVTKQVLIKSDGFPTYHLAVVVDDHLMEISHIVRAEEWLPSTPKHVLLYQYFEWKMSPLFHTATLRNPDKSKLSKRHGHTNVNWYKEEGFLPEAILNYLALLGWSHPEEKEIFSLDEFIKLFDLKDVKPIAPIFDLNKLLWMNGEYIREMSNEKLLERIYVFDESLKQLDHDTLLLLTEVAKTRIKTLKEFKESIMPFLEPVPLSLSEQEQELRKEFVHGLQEIEKWEVEPIVEYLKTFATNHSIKFGVYYKILIGRDRGLPLADTFQILGKESIMKLLS